jgi:G3E family GTPase
MRVHVVCGFLGSGKTTLLRHILERGGDERLAVIVNEFGQVGVDGAILAGQHVAMIEISAGCLCCTLKGSLVNALEELRDKKGVERVIIEATGVAQPRELVEVLADPALSTSVNLGPLVTVVDAAKFARLRTVLGEFYTAQIERAEVILLNKVDLAGPATLAATQEQVRQLNPGATLIRTERCRVDLDLILADAPRRPAPSALDPDVGSSGPAAPFMSFVVAADFDADGDRLRAFFIGLPTPIVRAKGFMTVDGRPSLVQYAAGQLEVTPAASATAPTMVFIAVGEPDHAVVEARFQETKRP